MDLKNFYAYQIIRGLKFVYDLFLLVSLYYQKCYVMIVIYILIDKNISMTQLLFLFS